jgi:hypothetical protein
MNTRITVASARSPGIRRDNSQLSIALTFRNRRALSALVFLSLALAWARAPSFAQQSGPSISEDTLADEVNDPIASLTQIQLKDLYTPAEYGTNAQPNTLQFRSVFAVRPHLLTPLEQLVRPTLQVVTVPRNKGASTTTALDDFQLLDLFVMPIPDERKTGFRWGLGTYWVFPTSTSQYTGRGAWQVGPAWGFAWQLERLKLSALFQQATSFAYTSSHSKSVAVQQIQPIINYDIGRGWYLTSSNANWRINLRHKSATEIPVSFGFGKVIKITNGYSINASLQGEWMAYRQFDPQTEQFTLVFNVSILLPQTEL